MATTTRGLPYPVTGDGRPHIDLAIKALADAVKVWEAPMTDAQIGALAGADLWDGRLVFQTDVGTVRKWRGLYMYLSGAAAWRCVCPISGGATWTPSVSAASGGLNLGSTGSVEGYYFEVGDIITARATFKWAGTGISAGTGLWTFTLPANAALTDRPIGRGLHKRNVTPINTSKFVGSVELTSATGAKVTGDSGDLSSTTAPMTTSPNTNSTYLSIVYRRA